MTLELKNELLKFKVLKGKYNYDITLYPLLENHYFGNVISKISVVSISFNVDIQEDEIDSKQFLTLLGKFVEVMKEYFFNIGPMIYVIDNIVKSNIIRMENYLSLKDNVSEDGNTVLEKIYKIISCYNFNLQAFLVFLFFEYTHIYCHNFLYFFFQK